MKPLTTGQAPLWRTLLAAAACALALAGAALPHAAQAWDAHRLQAAAQKLGPAAVSALPQLQQLAASLLPLDELARLRQVNEFFNLRIQFASDLEVWGVDDYWATPLQTLNAGRGDCEDYVIAKYTILLATGIPRSRLRLVYVRARMSDAPPGAPPLAHMVLAYYATPEAQPLILDNLRAEVLPATQRPDLTPVFSFNSEGLWQGVGNASAGDPMARLSRWRDVWARVQQEGFFQ